MSDSSTRIGDHSLEREPKLERMRDVLSERDGLGRKVHLAAATYRGAVSLFQMSATDYRLGAKDPGDLVATLETVASHAEEMLKLAREAAEIARTFTLVVTPASDENISHQTPDVE